MRKMQPRAHAWHYCCLVALFGSLLCLLPALTYAQDPAAQQRAGNLIGRHIKALGLTTAQLQNLTINDAHKDKVLDADLVYMQETYQGLPVYNSIKVAAFRNDQPISVTGGTFEVATRFAAQKNRQPSLQAFDAIVSAAKHLDLAVPNTGQPISTEPHRQKLKFGNLNISNEDIAVELMWVKQNNDDIRLAWQVLLIPRKSSDLWLIHVDAITGSVINKANLTVSCNWSQPLPMQSEAAMDKLVDNYEKALVGHHYQPTHFTPEAPPPPTISSAAYRVLPYPVESPNHGSFSLVNDPWLLAGPGNSSGSLGWHNDGTTEYSSTRGNNVWAKEDRAGDNETTIGVSTTSTTAAPNYTFNDVFDPATTPTGTVNQKAAITNLFYWNNIMHDMTYQYGFDEVSGNFQNDNLARGGLGGDYVLADAQDGSGSNNANFSTPVDGSNPRMQMFLFSPPPATILNINSAPTAIAAMNAFELVISSNNKLSTVGPVTGNLVLYDNGTNNGCSAIAAGSLTGKIAVVLFNQVCNPSVSAKNAQNAGAIGMVMQLPSNIPAANYSGGTDNTVTIPAVVIDFAPGNNLKSAMLNGAVNITLQGTSLDGDFDNGIIAHEYGHGISNRLTGGPGNTSCLFNKEQMGEGWSDYFALMMTTNWANATTADGPNRRPIGTYALGQSVTDGGIRTYPYSTDMTINHWTYALLATNTTVNGTPGQVHKVGEIWAATLWDMTWNIIAIDGINADLYKANDPGGNSVSMKLVMQGMKLQPCSPGFLDGRNAILKADTLLYGGRYSCAIWQAFARRGMGVNAIQGSSNSVLDQTANFALPNFNYDTSATVCGSFNWYGQILNTSGDYNQTVNMPGGCSRVVTLHLTVNKTGIVSITPSSTTACTNGTLTLTANGVSGATSVVNWYTQPKATGTFVGTGNSVSTTLGPRTYYALVTNSCPGDTTEISVVIGQQLTATFTKTDVSCFGESNGSLTNIVVSGGSSPYSISTLVSSGFANTNQITGLKASTYRIFMMDASGCTGFTSPIPLTQPGKINTVTTTTPATCFDAATGAINITNTSGGTAGFTYALSPSGPYVAATAFSNLKAGGYRVYTRDANACIGTGPLVTVSQPARMVTTFTKSDVTCFGTATGSISNISGTGGTGSLLQSLSPAGPFVSTTSFGNLRASTYRVYTRDANGCTVFTNPINIGQPTPLIAVGSGVNPSCDGALDGRIAGSASGGNPPYQYAKAATGPYQTSATLTGLKAGNYRVFVKDANGCVTFSPVITLTNPPIPCGPATFAKTATVNGTGKLSIQLSPNPAKDEFVVKVYSSSNGPVSLRIVDANGRQQQLLNGMPEQVFRFGRALQSGIYLLEVRQGNEVKTVKAVKIN